MFAHDRNDALDDGSGRRAGRERYDEREQSAAKLSWKRHGSLVTVA
jgi:hypothetical protein